MAESSAAGPAPAGKPESSSSVRLKRPELRRHPRFRTDEATAELYLKGFLSKFGIGRKNEARGAVNLSEGGILIILHSKLAAGTKVRVRIEMEHYNDIIEADGEIRWCTQSARDPSNYYAGVQFKDLPPAQASHLAKMRSWFTSPEFKQKSATRRRLAPPELQK